MQRGEYIKVSLLDVFRTSELARKDEKYSKIIDKLVNLFIEAEATEVDLPVDSEEARCILKYNKKIQSKSCITLESLGLAFNRLYFGKNDKELLKRIEKYYRTYMENIEKEADNTDLKQSIIADEKAFKLISDCSSYRTYEREITGRHSKVMVLKNQVETLPNLKGKSILE